MTDLKIRDNLWWLILATFWLIFGLYNLFFGVIYFVLLSALCLAGLLASARITVNQRREIRALKATNALLEQALREAHRRDYR